MDLVSPWKLVLSEMARRVWKQDKDDCQLSCWWQTDNRSVVVVELVVERVRFLHS